jgi:hypothetical protein
LTGMMYMLSDQRGSPIAAGARSGKVINPVTRPVPPTTRMLPELTGACWRCRSRNVAPETASGRATVAAYTINHHPWLPGFPPPYIVAIVELQDSPDVRLTTNIVECDIEDVHVGMPVEVTFEQREDVWLPLFKPVGR